MNSLIDTLLKNDRPLVIGHRGYAAKAPENTLASFRTCLDAGISAVEFDVHTCESGELVVIHDHNLGRTTGYDGVVEQTPLGRIRELDAGSWHSAAFTGERVPLLEEVFELLGTQMYYDIEIKWKVSRLSGLEEKLVAMIRRFGISDRSLVTSFNPFSLKEVRRLAPDIATGLLYTNDSDELPRILRRGAGRFICRPGTLNPAKHLVTPWFMLLNHRIAGYPVIPYTVNSPPEVRRLNALGVSGIISDDPGMVLSTLKDRVS